MPLMYLFILHVLIFLPPINPIQAAHPVNDFTVQSTPSYVGMDACQKAVERTGSYIESRLPEGAKVWIEVECLMPEVVES
jgi:hypothetical protein